MDNLHFIPNNILTNFFKELIKKKNDYQQCRGTIWQPNPYCCKSWSKKPNTMNSCRIWIEELGLNKLNGILHGVKEHTNKNKSHCIERSPEMIGL